MSFSLVMVGQLFAPQLQNKKFPCKSGRPLVRKSCGSKRFSVAPVRRKGASLHFGDRKCLARLLLSTLKPPVFLRRICGDKLILL